MRVGPDGNRLGKEAVVKVRQFGRKRADRAEHRDASNVQIAVLIVRRLGIVVVVAEGDANGMPPVSQRQPQLVLRRRTAIIGNVSFSLPPTIDGDRHPRWLRSCLITPGRHTNDVVSGTLDRELPVHVAGTGHDASRQNNAGRGVDVRAGDGGSGHGFRGVDVSLQQHGRDRQHVTDRVEPEADVV